MATDKGERLIQQLGYLSAVMLQLKNSVDVLPSSIDNLETKLDDLETSINNLVDKLDSCCKTTKNKKMDFKILRKKKL